MFGFAPYTYLANEGQLTTLTVTQMSGNPGEFQFSLIAATDDSNTLATATGNYHVLRMC